MTPKFEPGIGTVDGANKTFYTPTPYQTGTLSYFLNGQLKQQANDDGWFETDPSSGRVDLKEAPLPGDAVEPADDVVQFYYISAADAALQVQDQIAFLKGRVREVYRLKVTLNPVDPIKGRLRVVDEVNP